MAKNNLFHFATKELSQDAMLCWCINCINEPDSASQALGKATLDLFLGSNRQENYTEVEVRRQYKKIDVLIRYNKSCALIIEDKTNTFEHGDQIQRYKDILQKENGNTLRVYTAYVKTGIMYDEDWRIGEEKADQVVDLGKLLTVLRPFVHTVPSDILRDFVYYLDEIAIERCRLDQLIIDGEYKAAFSKRYGQFSFLNQVFSARSRGIKIGNEYDGVEYEKNQSVYIDNIFSGTNNSGMPWTEYCFWGQPYSEQSPDRPNKRIEYHSLFWRVEGHYVALRHYDDNAHSKDVSKNERKKTAYYHFRDIAKEIENANPSLFKWIGERSNYKESDLLYIETSKLKEMGNFEAVKKYMLMITETFIQQ